jgi:hypothetical protein
LSKKSRYHDADKHDSVWAFVPALRRVRAGDPASRSDGYLVAGASPSPAYARQPISSREIEIAWPAMLLIQNTLPSARAPLPVR